MTNFSHAEEPMKIAEIDWPLFWQAWRQQNPFEREQWLARWVFADDAVKLSMRPVAPERMRDKPVQGGEDPVSAKIAARQIMRKRNSERTNRTGTDHGGKFHPGAPAVSCLYPVD